MIRLWLTFLICSLLIHLGISGWRNMSGLERWSLTKSAVYSIIVALLATTVLTLIVIVF